MTDYDLVIIGGGIHGVGCAQAAAARGYKTLLIEKSQLAAGTSGRSSKLIHGGLRYLESGQYRLVRESLRERGLLLKLAPDLVRIAPFHIPVYRETRRRPWQLRIGLAMYAALAGLTRHARFGMVARSKWETLDGLRTDGLQAVFRYFDAQTDDAALTRAIWRSAAELGAELMQPAEFTGAERRHDGYTVRMRTPAGDRECHARALVNAAGPWVHLAMARIAPTPTAPQVALVQGTHIVLDTPLRAGNYYTEARDGRAIFCMPWQGRALVGTTETAYEGDPDKAVPLPAEIEYLQQTWRHYFPARAPAVVESFTGLRVLPQGTGDAFHRSRSPRILQTPDHPALVSIYGGKLTGYRATAERTLAMLGTCLPAPRAASDTARIPLVAE
jgi:glycerol-3-phosphate dehydrogenase